VLAGAFGSGVAKRMSGGGFDDPASASSRAQNALHTTFHAGEPNFVLLVTAKDGVDDPAAARAGEALTARLAARPDVTRVTSYWTADHAAALRSHDGTEALVVARLAEGHGRDDPPELARHLEQAFVGTDGPLTVRAGGSAVVFAAIGDRITADLSRAEAIAFPVTFVLLVLVFGGVVAALLPLAIGVLAVLGTLLILRGITSVTDVSIYALNLTTGLGLGLAIDYSLFVVTRYREELARGLPTTEAIVATLRTAGRTVVFSAVTVGLSLAALLVFPL